MNQTRKFASALLVVAVVLLTAQFVLIFGTDVLPDDERTSVLLVHLAPISLALVSLYLLFGQSKTPQSGLGRTAVVLLASYALAGAMFLIITIVALAAFGTNAVESLFSNLLIFIVAGMIVVLPVVVSRLR